MPADTLHLESSKHAWLDERFELERLPQSERTSHRALVREAEILHRLRSWKPMETVARTLAFRYPRDGSWKILLACALRRGQSEKTADLFVDKCLASAGDGFTLYSLACYACRLQDLATARAFLNRALELEPALRRQASDDPDLAPLKQS
jgi:hypothetical protein